MSLAMACWMGTGPVMSAGSPRIQHRAVVAAVTLLLAGQMQFRFPNLLTQGKLWSWHSPIPASQPHTRPGSKAALQSPRISGQGSASAPGSHMAGVDFWQSPANAPLTPGSRNRQKVNKEGKRKAGTNLPAHAVAIRGLLARGNSPCLKTAAASALFNQKPGVQRSRGAPRLTPQAPDPAQEHGQEALKELPDPLQGAL